MEAGEEILQEKIQTYLSFGAAAFDVVCVWGGICGDFCSGGRRELFGVSLGRDYRDYDDDELSDVGN